MPRERPYGCAAEKRDELAPLHSCPPKGNDRRIVATRTDGAEGPVNVRFGPKADIMPPIRSPHRRARQFATIHGVAARSKLVGATLALSPGCDPGNGRDVLISGESVPVAALARFVGDGTFALLGDGRV